MTPEAIAMLEPGETTNSIQSTLASTRYVRFGGLQVDQQRQEVTKNGVRLKLQGKVYQVLIALLERPGDVVTREELRQRLWPADTHVNYDANVNTTVNKLRQALGDSSDKPTYIETIPRRGYCFVMQAEASDEAATPQAIASSVEAELDSSSPETNGAPSLRNSGVWITAGVIGLILTGMLLGAALTKFFILHVASTSI